MKMEKKLKKARKIIKKGICNLGYDIAEGVIGTVIFTHTVVLLVKTLYES